MTSALLLALLLSAPGEVPNDLPTERSVGSAGAPQTEALAPPELDASSSNVIRELRTPVSFAVQTESLLSSLWHKIDKPFLVAVVADGATTEGVTARGWYETNPLPGMKSSLGRVAWGAGWVVGVSLAADELDQSGHRGWSRALRWTARVVEFLYVVWNSRLAIIGDSCYPDVWRSGCR